MTPIKYGGNFATYISKKSIFNSIRKQLYSTGLIKSVMNNQELGPQLAVDILQFYTTNLIA